MRESPVSSIGCRVSSVACRAFSGIAAGLLVVPVALLCMYPAALGVIPHTWVCATEADFSAGSLSSAVATSRGEAILAREIKVLMPSTSAPPVVSAVAVAGKTIYAAAGNTNVIYRIDGKKSREFAKPPGTVVTCLVWTGKDLLAGTGGKDAGIYRIDSRGKVTRVWADAKVKYVWAIVPDRGGKLYAATGPEARVFVVDRGKGSVVYQGDKLAKNILSLARNKDRLGEKLYAGTDQSGLVVEIDLGRKSSRILYDAPEKEIAALVAGPAGGLYVATADAAKARPDGAGKPKTGKDGKAVPATKPGAKPKTEKPAAKSAPGKRAATRPSAKPKTPPAKPPADAKAVVPARPRPGRRPGAAPKPPAKAPSGAGNAVYFIAPDGLVTTRFRRPVTILAMILHDDRLILGTGNGGKVYSVSTDGDQVTPLVDTDAKQITALAAADGGAIVFASANKGSVGTIGANYARRGTFVSNVLDAKQIARWGTLHGRADLPRGTRVTVATRSGNVSKAEDKDWSSWSREQPLDGEYRPIMSPAGRFLQFRLTLSGNGKATPIVDDLRLIHQVGNLAPIFSGVAVQVTNKDAQNKPASTRLYRHILIKAADPNGDRLAFDVDFRQAGSKNWIRIARKLAAPKYVWDTRTIGDGSYQVRVTASDSPSNPTGSALQAARVSDPVVIDNTAPVVRQLTTRAAEGKVTITGTAADATSRITTLYYAVDSQTRWTAALPTDGICDSPREKFAFDLPAGRDAVEGLKPGAHRIAVKAYDFFGNVGYAAVTVVVAK